MKSEIKFLPSRRGSDPEIWRNEIMAYESQNIDWSRFTEDDAFIESVLKIPERWKELHEEYLRTNLTREQYIERCKRNKENLERFLKEHVINRAKKKPGYLKKEYSGTLPALIKYIQSFIDDYGKEIERESKLLPQEEPLEIQNAESGRLQEVGKKVVEGGRKGAEIASHNSEKNRRRDQVLKRYDEIMNQSHKMSETVVKKQLAKEFRINISTVYRYLQNK